MFTPLIIIVSLFIGSTSFAKKHESYESAVEREVQQAKLEMGDEETVVAYLKNHQTDPSTAGKNEFQNIPRVDVDKYLAR